MRNQCKLRYLEESLTLQKVLVQTTVLSSRGACHQRVKLMCWVGQCTGIIISGLVVCGWMTKWVD